MFLQNDNISAILNEIEDIMLAVVEASAIPRSDGDCFIFILCSSGG